MKRIGLLWVFVAAASAQNYNHPTTGVGGTYAGGCQVHTCSGTYYDNGGPASNYANSVQLVYWTFCPNNSTQCLRATFTSFNVESGCLFGRCCGSYGISCPGEPCCYDWLSIGNGPAQNSPLLFWGCGTTGPGTVTSSDASGCLTFRFCSDGSTTRSGWSATLSCVNCTRQPAGNSDCQASTPICSNAALTDFSYGPGGSAQCGGCITNENYTNFYIFQPQGASGNIQLSMCPSNGTDDYDFAIWGPFATNNLSVLCGSLGTPVRCSYAMYPVWMGCGAPGACTGLQNGNADNSEDVCGNGWVAPLSVTAGSYYILMVNGWTAGAQGYNLTWTLPPGMTLNCTPLSQPVVAFQAEAHASEGVFLRWSYDARRLSPTENLAGWAIDRSGDGGQSWQTIAQLPTEITTFMDRSPFVGENLYRLRYGYEDGHTEVYIKPQRVEWYPAAGSPFTAWYDASGESIHLQIFDQGRSGTVELYTLDGRLVNRLEVESSPFLTAMGFVVKDPGVYVVRYGGASIVVPVVK